VDISGKVGVHGLFGQQGENVGAVTRTRRTEGGDPASAARYHHGLATLGLIEQGRKGTARLSRSHGTHQIRLSDARWPSNRSGVELLSRG